MDTRKEGQAGEPVHVVAGRGTVSFPFTSGHPKGTAIKKAHHYMAHQL